MKIASPHTVSWTRFCQCSVQDEIPCRLWKFSLRVATLGSSLLVITKFLTEWRKDVVLSVVIIWLASVLISGGRWSLMSGRLHCWRMAMIIQLPRPRVNWSSSREICNSLMTTMMALAAFLSASHPRTLSDADKDSVWSSLYGMLTTELIMIDESQPTYLKDARKPMPMLPKTKNKWGPMFL